MALIEVPAARFKPCMDSYLGSVWGVLKGLADEREMDELWGLSTFAFRTQIHRTLQPNGLLPRKWDQTCAAVLKSLGYDSDVGLRDFFYTPNDLRELQFAWMNKVEKALDDGRAAICYGLHGPAFGIIRGFDPDSEDYAVSTYMDGRLEKPVNAQDIGTANPPLVFMQIPTGPLPDYDPQVAARTALRRALDHHLGREKDEKGALVVVPPELVYGPAAYNAWSTALEVGQVEPHWGAGYYAGYYVEARSAAATWLKRLAADPAWAAQQARLEKAAAHLEHEAESIAQLAKLFPFNQPEALQAPARRTEASTCLRAARAEHIAAMELLVEIDP